MPADGTNATRVDGTEIVTNRKGLTFNRTTNLQLDGLLAAVTEVLGRLFTSGAVIAWWCCPEDGLKTTLEKALSQGVSEPLLLLVQQVWAVCVILCIPHSSPHCMGVSVK